MKKMSRRPSPSKSKSATPAPIVSGRYFCEVGEAECLKLMPTCAVTSAKTTGEGDCGAGGAARRAGAAVS